MYCIVLHKLHYIVLHYITIHYITIHYITLQYITLHYIALQITQIISGNQNEIDFLRELSWKTKKKNNVFKQQHSLQHQIF